MSGNPQSSWLPTNSSMDGNDKQRTPKQQSHHLKPSQRPKIRLSNIGSKSAGTQNDPEILDGAVTPITSVLNTFSINLELLKKGDAHDPITFNSDEDEPVPNAIARPKPDTQTYRPTPRSRSTSNSNENASISMPSPAPQKSPEKTATRIDEQPITQIRPKQARKSLPCQNPDGLLRRQNERHARKEHDDRPIQSGAYDGTTVEDDTPIERTYKPPNQPRWENTRDLAKQMEETRARAKLPTMERRQSQAASLVDWPQCSACKDAGILCDGEAPCAPCGDVIDCDNPVKAPPPLLIPPSTPKPIDPNSNNVEQPNIDLGVDVSEAESTTGSALDEIFLDIPFFEHQVLKAEKEMYDHQEYMLRRILNQERMAAKRAPGPALTEQLSSLFAKLKPQIGEPGNSFTLQVRDPPSGAAATKPIPWKLVESSVTTIVSDVQCLPRYKSIGRLGPLPLTKNVTIGKYNPYFPEDEALDEDFRASKYQEVRDRYKSYEQFSGTINSQRECAELSAMWHPFALDLITSLQTDVASIAAFSASGSNMADMDFAGVGIGDAELAVCFQEQLFPCKKCDLNTEPPWELQSLWDKMEEDLNKSARSYAIAGLLCHAFRKVTGLKLWHVIRGDASLRTYVENRTGHRGRTPQSVNGTTFCLVCGLTNCASHGAYKEGNGAKKRTVLINDPEDALNLHQMVIRPRPAAANKTEHMCGVWCVDSAKDCGQTLRGLHKDGEVRGAFRNEMENAKSAFDAKALCGSDACFWDVECRKMQSENPNRPKSKTDLTADHRRAFENCLEMFLGNERGPCMAKDFMPGVSCVNIFFLMLSEIQATEHRFIARKRPSLFTSDSQKARKLKGKRKLKQDMTSVEERPVFLPCSHDGPCQGNPSCTCFRNDVECEYTCGCDMSCERRFRGCSCKCSPGQVCLENTCECWMSSRECDPWLCGTCGVVEVLDQANKYKDDIRNGRCKNNRLQLGLPARTIKAPSEVQGYGLFAGEDILRNGFIGEYKGEVTSRTESDRRGITYHLSGMEYLFNLNYDQEIDASNFGNKTRFMNNSSEEQNINVLGATLLCNGVQRVMLYAKRDIKAGEELLYDYAYPEHVLEKFWERGQEPASKNAMIVAPSSKRTTGKGRRARPRNAGGLFQRMKKGANESDDDDSRSPAPTKKRKRIDDDLEVPQSTDDGFDVTEPLPFVETADDSDYSEAANNSAGASEESEEGIPESRSGEEVGSSSTPRGKTRKKAGPGDRRRGGEAQSRAWETRKRRLAMNGQ